MTGLLRHGNGSEQAPFCAADGTAGIQTELVQLLERGGVLQLPCGRYDIERSVIVDASSSCLSGGVWACNTDPNGVFESKFGTKLRCHETDYSAIIVGKSNDLLSGPVLRDLGIQGDIIGMDTRPLVDWASPEKAAGLCFYKARIDQGAFSKLSFCGLSNAVAAVGEAELDACVFENLNADGCGNGFWFAPRASYYTRFRSCVVADNPYYGFYLGGKGRQIHNLELQDCYFVRNGGAFSNNDEQLPAAVLFDHISNCAVTNCIFDAPGTFWFYDADAAQNNQRQPSRRSTNALHIIGDNNRIRNNTFLNSSADSIRIEGNGNILIGNIVDGNVHVRGEGNVITSMVFSTPEARIVLDGSAANTTVLQGVEDWRIVKV